MDDLHGPSRARYIYLILLPVLILAVVAGINGRLDPLAVYFADRFTNRRQVSPNEICIWHTWGGTQKELLEKVVRKFEEENPPLKVRTVFIGYSSQNNPKFFTAVAAKRAPDVVFVDGTQVSEWASLGALQPLDDRIRAAGIKPEDFYTPCWKQCNFLGNTWALTYCADPNFAFAWNKTAFRRSGLDPERPPRTMSELDAMADKLTSSRNGHLESIGIIPWGQFGSANSMFTWGWVFGGEFYDEEKRKITANDPRNVAALEWMVSYARKYGLTRITSMSQGFGALDQNPLYIGKLGMSCFHIIQVEDVKTYAPKLDYGLGPIPYPPGGEPHSSWVGGWCLALPRGSRHPDLGWKFLKWACADPKGTTVVGQVQDLFPGYRRSPYLDSVRDDPRYGIFLDILEQCRHQRPVMPAQAYYMAALDRAVEAALYGQKTPKQALDDATIETQRELELRMAGR